MLLKVLKCTADNRCMDKSSTLITTKDCKLKDGSSIVDPILITKKLSQAHTRDFNYAKIEEYGRYYFVTNIIQLPSNMIEIHLHCDVLSSFKNQIKNITTLILRQENVYNPYFVDEQALVRCTRKRDKKNIGTVGNGSHYYLTVNNGGV